MRYKIYDRSVSELVSLKFWDSAKDGCIYFGIDNDSKKKELALVAIKYEDLPAIIDALQFLNSQKVNG